MGEVVKEGIGGDGDVGGPARHLQSVFASAFGMKVFGGDSKDLFIALTASS